MRKDHLILILIISIVGCFIISQCGNGNEQLVEDNTYQLIDSSHYILEENTEVVKFQYPGSDSAAHYIELMDSLTPEQRVYLEDITGDSISYSNYESGTDFEYRKNKTLYYNFHCTASREGADIKAERWLLFFKNERGWSRPGYNWIIELDGSLKPLQGSNFDGYTAFNEISYGVKGRNLYSINIAYVGGVDKNLKPKDTMNEAQIKTADALFRIIRLSDPAAIVHGHRDNPNVNKACPSLDVETKFLGMINKKAS